MRRDEGAFKINTPRRQGQTARLAATVSGGLLVLLGAGAAFSGQAVQPPHSAPLPPPPPVRAPLTVAGGLALLGLTLAVIAVATWNEWGRPWPSRRAAPAPPLVPKARLGATPHERLHDAPYLRRILDAELNSSQPAGSDNRSAQVAPPPEQVNDATAAPERGEP